MPNLITDKMFSCFRNCFDTFGLITVQHETKRDENSIALDASNMGKLYKVLPA